MIYFFSLVGLLLVAHVFLEFKNLFFDIRSRKAIRKPKNSRVPCVFCSRVDSGDRIIELKCNHPNKYGVLPNESACEICSDGVVAALGINYNTACTFIKGYWEIIRVLISFLVTLLCSVMAIYFAYLKYLKGI